MLKRSLHKKLKIRRISSWSPWIFANFHKLLQLLSIMTLQIIWGLLECDIFWQNAIVCWNIWLNNLNEVDFLLLVLGILFHGHQWVHQINYQRPPWQKTFPQSAETTAWEWKLMEELPSLFILSTLTHFKWMHLVISSKILR